ncbi:MAG: hypothetical protein ACJ735_11880 [Actinomycetes bacterium]
MPRRLPWATAAVVLVVAAVGAIVVATSGSEHTRPVAAASTPSPTASAAPSPTPVAPRPSPIPRRPAPRAVHRALLFPLPAGPVQPQPCPPPPLPPGKPLPPLPAPATAESRLPQPAPLQARRVDLSPVRGKGMWLTTWPTSHLDVGAIVARSRAAGVHQLWVRTGGTKQGWYGGRILPALLPAAHAAGIAVIAWDFPTLSDPAADAARARASLQGQFGGQHIDGFSTDIETTSERVYDTSRRVRLYLSLVRRYAGSRPVVATVPRPTAHRLATYPYAAQAPYVDVFAPMVYWSCSEPGAMVTSSLAPLRKYHRALSVVGQSYDMGPEGGRHGLPSAHEIWRFLDVSKRAGAVGASLYTYDQTHAAQWRALSRFPGWAA